MSRLDRLRNEEVRERTGVRKELAARVDTNVLRWFGHVERMESGRLTKKVMNSKVDGRNVNLLNLLKYFASKMSGDHG